MKKLFIKTIIFLFTIAISVPTYAKKPPESFKFDVAYIEEGEPAPANGYFLTPEAMASIQVQYEILNKEKLIDEESYKLKLRTKDDFHELRLKLHEDTYKERLELRDQSLSIVRAQLAEERKENMKNHNRVMIVLFLGFVAGSVTSLVIFHLSGKSINSNSEAR